MLQAEVWLLKAKALAKGAGSSAEAARSRIPDRCNCSLQRPASTERPLTPTIEQATLKYPSASLDGQGDHLPMRLHCYHRAADAKGVAEMRNKLQTLGSTSTPCPTLLRPHARQIPWFWLRLAFELSILAVAAGLYLPLACDEPSKEPADREAQRGEGEARGGCKEHPARHKANCAGSDEARLRDGRIRRVWKGSAGQRPGTRCSRGPPESESPATASIHNELVGSRVAQAGQPPGNKPGALLKRFVVAA